MDEILAKASSQAVTFAIRSGISLASGFAIKTVTKFLDRIPEDEKRKIMSTKNKIQTKIEILTMSIDLIKLAAARGNTSLESTINLINELNNDIEIFEETVNRITNDLNNANEKDSIKRVEAYMKDLLEQINDNIPILNLALVTCGINLNGNLANSISPGRLLQASNYITRSNDLFNKKDFIQVGPTFDLVLYSIFYNPSRLKYLDEEDNKSTDELSCISWKEDFARCSGKIIRKVSHDLKYTYDLELHEDINDGRYHEDNLNPQLKAYNIDLIKRLFFSASGKLLRLESRSSPVLILKLVDANDKEEWLALGETKEGEFDDSDDSDGETEDNDNGPEKFYDSNDLIPDAKNNSLSLLEYVIRLGKLQQIEQKSILGINDEKLSLYLKDENESLTNNEIISKNKRQKQIDLIKNEKMDHSMTLTSNISRLKNLNLESDNIY